MKNQIHKKKTNKPFNQLKKELIKIINNIETDNKIIKLGLSFIKRYN
jgi:hypothetical protein